MAERKLIETVYGKRHKYEVFRTTKTLGGFEFQIYRDGAYYRGGFDNLAKAMEVARSEN